MKFWVIISKQQKDVFYNVASDGNTSVLTEQCLLPTESLALQLIKDRLLDSYTVVDVTLVSTGTWVLSIGHLDDGGNSIKPKVLKESTYIERSLRQAVRCSLK